jgi:hypothetical protein
MRSGYRHPFMLGRALRADVGHARAEGWLMSRACLASLAYAGEQFVQLVVADLR